MGPQPPLATRPHSTHPLRAMAPVMSLSATRVRAMRTAGRRNTVRVSAVGEGARERTKGKEESSKDKEANLGGLRSTGADYMTKEVSEEVKKEKERLQAEAEEFTDFNGATIKGPKYTESIDGGCW